MVVAAGQPAHPMPIPGAHPHTRGVRCSDAHDAARQGACQGSAGAPRGLARERDGSGSRPAGYDRRGGGAAAGGPDRMGKAGAGGGQHRRPSIGGARRFAGTAGAVGKRPLICPTMGICVGPGRPRPRMRSPQRFATSSNAKRRSRGRTSSRPRSIPDCPSPSKPWSAVSKC